MDVTKDMILIALEEHKGIVSYACKSIGLARSTFYNWLATDEVFKAAVDEIQDVALDYVESKLFEKIDGVKVKKGDEESDVYDVPPSDTAIIFYLKTKGKKRGYVEKTELDANHSGGINIIFEPTPNCQPIADDYQQDQVHTGIPGE